MHLQQRTQGNDFHETGEGSASESLRIDVGDGYVMLIPYPLAHRSESDWPAGTVRVEQPFPQARAA